jgi:ribonuclease P/MRP protein subunit RPP1
MAPPPHPSGGYERVAICHHVTLKRGVQLKAAPDVTELVERTPVTKRGRQLEVLQRLTVMVDDPALLHTLSSPAAESYDLLAVCPASDKVFLQACSVLPIDIVTFNLAEKLPFVLRFSQISQAVERGLSLEICYSPALRGSSGRRNTLSSAQELVKGCRGKGVLVSSGGERALDFRPPLDVVNMSRLFGLTDIQCKAAITSVSRAALLHSRMRRHSAKAVVSSHPLPAGRRKREREEDSETSVKKFQKR